MTGKRFNDVVERLARRAEVMPYSNAGRALGGAVIVHTLGHSVAWRMLRVEEDNTFYDLQTRLRQAPIVTSERRYDHFETI